MWTEFYLGIVIATCILYVPGYLFWRGLGFSTLLALCLAPVFSFCAYCVLPIAYYELGVFCNGVSVGAPVLAIGAISYAVRRLRGKTDSAQISASYHDEVSIGCIKLSYNQALCILYLAVSVFVCAYVLLANLSTPEAFVNRFDNQTHLNLARSFLDSGKWSTLHSSEWLASPEYERSYPGDGNFYPCAWHCLVALICSITKLSVPAAMNALLATVRMFVFPLGELCFMRSLFPRDRYIPMWGAITASAFANWPWHITVTGPLFPNNLGLSLLFAILGAVVIFVDGGYASKAPVTLALLSVVSFLALTIAHPNTVFSAYVFLAFYGATVVNKNLSYASTRESREGASKRMFALLAYAAVIVGVWVACYQVPLLSSVINYGTSEASSPLQAIASAVALRFAFTGTQYGMTLACLCGFVALIWRSDRWRIACPVCFFALAYIATRSGWTFLKYWIRTLVFRPSQTRHQSNSLPHACCRAWT